MALAATAHKVPTGMVNALEGPRITGKGGWTGGIWWSEEVLERSTA